MKLSNKSNDDNYENDDLITFQLDLKTVCLHFSQFVKYSKHIRDGYLFSDVPKQIPDEIKDIKTKSQICTENIILFFQLLQQNYDIINDNKITYKACVDLLKLSKYFKVRKLDGNINKYIKEQNENVDFAIQMIQYANDTTNDRTEIEQSISKDIENVLVNKINDCLANEKFADLPISIIYRIVSKSSKKIIKSDKLFDFIKRPLSKFYVLFQFVELAHLSDDKLDEICEIYSNSDDMTKQQFNYLKCNLNLINKMRTNRKISQSEIETKNTEIETKNTEIESMKQKLSEMNELKRKFKELEAELEISKKDKNQIEERLKISEQMKKSIEDEKVKLQQELEEERRPKIGGEIVAKVKSGLLHIHLRSRQDLLCSCIDFDYEGKTSKELILASGRYKLEVWGAQGGDSAGKYYESRKPGKGGLGGYSNGILNLSEQERLHVVVGESGHTSNSTEDSTTAGSFPDGGGTQTGYGYKDWKSVPGTGGGSTSIRISADSIDTRVIVAGGGGGASGSTHDTNDGGFGGGMNGGNCYQIGKLKEQGSGTQTGSTCGLGNGSNGYAGKFGRGADGKYKNETNSGGGGGGGWYGGGGGGHGYPTDSSSGGGGSGWVFTESNLKAWKSGDPTNANHFILTSKYYLTNASTIGGDQQFPNPKGDGNETGHCGNGYAKITPL